LIPAQAFSDIMKPFINILIAVQDSFRCKHDRAFGGLKPGIGLILETAKHLLRYRPWTIEDTGGAIPYKC
jgi:hypothetical protein